MNMDFKEILSINRAVHSTKYALVMSWFDKKLHQAWAELGKAQVSLTLAVALLNWISFTNQYFQIKFTHLYLILDWLDKVYQIKSSIRVRNCTFWLVTDFFLDEIGCNT